MADKTLEGKSATELQAIYETLSRDIYNAQLKRANIQAQIDQSDSHLKQLKGEIERHEEIHRQLKEQKVEAHSQKLDQRERNISYREQQLIKGERELREKEVLHDKVRQAQKELGEKSIEIETLLRRAKRNFDESESARNEYLSKSAELDQRKIDLDIQKAEQDRLQVAFDKREFDLNEREKSLRAREAQVQMGLSFLNEESPENGEQKLEESIKEESSVEKEVTEDIPIRRGPGRPRKVRVP